jgi:hypothetical protein
LLPRKRNWEAHGKQERLYILEARRGVGHMGVSLGAEKRAATFDLLRQPFSILRVEPTATVAQISEAFEDASADGLASESELFAARQAIVSPRLRLAAELASLLDTPPGEAKAVYSALQSEASLTDLRRVADRLSPLSRANVLAHIAAHQPADADLLVALVDAHSSMSAATLQPTIERVRKAAGGVSPSLDALNAALDDLIARHSKAAFEGFPTIRNAAAPVHACTTRVLASPSRDRIEALDGIIRAYAQSIGPELLRDEERVKAACDSLRAQPTNPHSVAAIAKAVRDWHALGASLMALEAHKGRDDGRARELFHQVRGLAVDVANDHQQYDLALSLTKVALEAFSALPRAADQLKEDLLLLEERAGEDRRSIERNLLEKQMQEHMKANRVSEALAVVSKLLDGYKSPEERDFLRGIQAKLESRRTARIVRWAFCGLLGAVGLVGALSDKSSPNPSNTQRPVQPFPTYQPPSAQGDYTSPPTATPPTVRTPAEVMPLVGSGREFSQGNLRYCLYQKKRLQSAQKSLTNNKDVEAFNKLVDDWNSRCANYYRYLESDMVAVMMDLSKEKETLEKDGKKIIDGWPWRGAR